MIAPDAKDRIRQQVLALGKALGRERASLDDGEVLPETGLLDSAAIMQLILWCESEFGISTDDEELTLDNFGTINQMVDYIGRHQGR